MSCLGLCPVASEQEKLLALQGDLLFVDDQDVSKCMDCITSY